ncbi:hypothetical protein JCGZ_03626 [Jatropha curcas]|uniref:DRBM domain-containing protein n=1 Tax=Jatropha curcas TaxID=180498 RepID=A0A067L9F5_JATCU|nr:hypothetical protein JCGZ_03626 [Jatropha curcas]
MIDKDPKYCKSILHEYAVRMNLGTPKYKTIQGEGVGPGFISSSFFDGKTCTGEVCASKKQAEQLAAGAAIQTLLRTDSGVLQQVINSKAKVCKALHKVRTSSFKQSNLSTIQKSVESSPQLINVRPTRGGCSQLHGLSKLKPGKQECAKSGEKNMRSYGQ